MSKARGPPDALSAGQVLSGPPPQRPTGGLRAPWVTRRPRVLSGIVEQVLSNRTIKRAIPSFTDIYMLNVYFSKNYKFEYLQMDLNCLSDTVYLAHC